MGVVVGVVVLDDVEVTEGVGVFELVGVTEGVGVIEGVVVTEGVGVIELVGVIDDVGVFVGVTDCVGVIDGVGVSEGVGVLDILGLGVSEGNTTSELPLFGLQHKSGILIESLTLIFKTSFNGKVISPCSLVILNSPIYPPGFLVSCEVNW